MSQNQGGLSEDELREYINSKYSLRLDRDALVKPSSDVIIDVYQKFLDEFWPPWRRDPGAFREGEGHPPVKIMMVKYLRIIIKIYNNSYSFELSDLISPTRQRTRLTLSILVYHRERVQDILSKNNDDKEELLLEQEEVSHKKQEIAQAKERIEELAIALSTSKPVEELKLSILEGERELEHIKKECEDISAEAKQVKSNNLSLRELGDADKARADSLEQEIQGLLKTLETLNNGLHIEKKIADTERIIFEEESALQQIQANIKTAKKKENYLERLVSAQRVFEREVTPFMDLRNSIKNYKSGYETKKASRERHQKSILEHQKREESMQRKLASSQSDLQELELAIKTGIEKAKINYEAKLGESRNKVRAMIKEGDQAKQDTEMANKARAELKLSFEEVLEKTQKMIEKAQKRMKLFEDIYLKSREQTEQNQAIIVERLSKINTLIGVVESEVTMVEMPANRTYIKNSA